MADASIKPDPDSKAGASPGLSNLNDEDIYEDAGDLEFNNEPEFQKIYLARVPRYVWEAWHKLDDDAEIQIGTIRQSQETNPNGEQREHMRMLLSSDLGIHQMIPKEYHLDITSEDVKNTFVFTEQDLPGYKSRSQIKFNPASANMPSRLTRPAKVEKAKQPFDPDRKFKEFYKKAIPKRTTIAGRIAHEVNCVAVDNKETRYLLGQMTAEAMRPKHVTKFVSEDLSSGNVGYVQPGTIGAMNAFGGFIKTKGTATGNRPQMQKTARMAQNELLDRIFECFREYNYWSMKAFRARLEQPEAYLRETLEKIAILAKSGPFSAHWSLKPENRMGNYEGANDAMAPDAGLVEESDTGMDDDDDDEDVKFEDVVS